MSAHRTSIHLSLARALVHTFTLCCLQMPAGVTILHIHVLNKYSTSIRITHVPVLRAQFSECSTHPYLLHLNIPPMFSVFDFQIAKRIDDCPPEQHEFTSILVVDTFSLWLLLMLHRMLIQLDGSKLCIVPSKNHYSEKMEFQHLYVSCTQTSTRII